MSLEPLKFGTVTGRFIAAIADTTNDEDAEPEALPMNGTVMFVPDIKITTIAGASGGPVTAVLTPVIATLDEQGYISHNGVRGVRLIASDNPGANPSNVTWTVTPSFRYGSVTVPFKSWNIQVPSNQVVDLTNSAPVSTGGAVAITRGVGVQSVERVDDTFVMVLDDGRRLDPVAIPSGSGLFVQDTQPAMAPGSLWVQTGLGTSGTDFTFWIEDGQ